MLSCQKYNLVTFKLNLQKLKARLDVKMPVEGGRGLLWLLASLVLAVLMLCQAAA